MGAKIVKKSENGKVKREKYGMLSARFIKGSKGELRGQRGLRDQRGNQ